MKKLATYKEILVSSWILKLCKNFRRTYLPFRISINRFKAQWAHWPFLCRVIKRCWSGYSYIRQKIVRSPEYVIIWLQWNFKILMIFRIFITQYDFDMPWYDDNFETHINVSVGHKTMKISDAKLFDDPCRKTSIFMYIWAKLAWESTGGVNVTGGL